MKFVDLRSVVAKGLKSENLNDVYTDYLGTKIKPHEYKCISSFLCKMRQKHPLVLSSEKEDGFDTNGYFLGFKIPHIDQEFDLLRFSKNFILNIELKSKTPKKGMEEIAKQLKVHKHYLLSFGNYKDVRLYTYKLDERKLYTLDDKSCLIEGNWDILAKEMSAKLELDANPEKLCKPSNYLVSPFNNTERFCEGAYFLTQEQEGYLNTVINNYPNNYMIEGAAGTGKTLLVYTIAQHYKEMGKKTLIVHGGNLNNGQDELNKNGFKIIPIKDFQKYKFENEQVLIVDEAQRVSKDSDLEKMYNFKGQLIFSGDPRQTLGAGEDGDTNLEEIAKNVERTFILRHKIRTNRSIATFIEKIFDGHDYHDISDINEKNISIEYFDNNYDAMCFAASLKRNDCEVINLTPSTFNREIYSDFESITSDVSHSVIGQEFDKVATFIGDNFYYKDHKLNSQQGSTYYPSINSLFENLTRCREKLCIIVIDNPEVFENCIAILNKAKVSSVK